MAGLIEDYALIGDMQTAALVCRDGSIDWACFPRFDSPACFAALLGTEEHGAWRIAPAAGASLSRRRYRHDTLILETEWENAAGAVRVIDFMPPRGEAPDIVRIVEGLHGTVEMRCELRMRFDYGHVIPWVRRVAEDLVAIAGPDALWLRTPVPLRGRPYVHTATFAVDAGERVPFVLTWHPSHRRRPRLAEAEAALADTERFWRRWVSQCDYEGPWRDTVVRSLITLKALTYKPTGGIVAAPTTSLPEVLGGVRNWDYRYCWLRDATITLEALLRSGYRTEAVAWREWLLRAVAGDPGDLQIMYGLAGERRITEFEAGWLPGYHGSRPVRIGNAAVDQLQLDVFGEVVDSLYLALRAGIEPEPHVWSLVQAMLDFLADHWRHPDQGLWEIRGAPRHFVHSKVMAWLAFDCGVRMIEEFGRPGPARRWREIRDAIHREVCARGVDRGRGVFTQAYGSTDLDAAALFIPRVGFLPPDDPRVVATVEAIQRELVSDGLIRRYDTGHDVDGLPGDEGAFLACSFWLVEALLSIGRVEAAGELFERLVGLGNDVGLLAEEYDPSQGRQLGNFPQAFSHVPLIRAAYGLADFDDLRHHGRRHIKPGHEPR